MATTITRHNLAKDGPAPFGTQFLERLQLLEGRIGSYSYKRLQELYGADHTETLGLLRSADSVSKLDFLYRWKDDETPEQMALRCVRYRVLGEAAIIAPAFSAMFWIQFGIYGALVGAVCAALFAGFNYGMTMYWARKRLAMAATD